MKEYALFLGCLIPARLPYLEKASIKLLEELGIRTELMKGASCCPDPIVMRSIDYRTWLAVAARNLSIAGEMGSDILTLCSGCFSTLSKASKALRENADLRKEVGEFLSEIDRSLSVDVKVAHVMEIVREIGPEAIRRHLRKPLKNLRVASHPGCHLVRPSDVVHVDDPNRPTILDEVVGWVGAEPVDYALKMLCCGVGIKEVDWDTNLLMLREKLKSVRDYGANCIMTPCPFCFLQFDRGQREVDRKFHENFAFPVFYVTELLGLALGFSPEEMGLHLHTTPVEGVL